MYLGEVEFNFESSFKVWIVSDRAADVVDVIYVTMLLFLWGALGWVKQQGEKSW
jgi:hypothetical protein